jgi:hypothetical protein
MKFKRSILFVVIAIGITLLAAGVRLYAAEELDIDYDEPVYLEAAIEYAGYIRSGQYKMLAWSETNYEHPVFYKILYGVVILPEPQLETLNRWDFIMLSPMRESQAVEYGMAGRFLSVFFGVVAVSILAFINPIAGAFLAINSMSVKYTSMFYLEALPMLTSFLAVLCYLGFYRSAQKHPVSRKNMVLLLGLSAIFLGVTAASKYIYCAAGLAIGVHALVSILHKRLSKHEILFLLGWGVLSLVVFFICNPYLWPHPHTRLLNSLTFHLDYPTTQTVISYHYPFWQPLRWLFNPFGYFNPRPETAFIFQVDALIFIFAVFGLYRSYRKEFMFFVWFVVALVVLLLWGTKWPQYILILLVPYSMIAAQGVITCYQGARLIWSKFFSKTTIQAA